MLYNRTSFQDETRGVSFNGRPSPDLQKQPLVTGSEEKNVGDPSNAHTHTHTHMV